MSGPDLALLAGFLVSVALATEKSSGKAGAVVAQAASIQICGSTDFSGL